MAKPNDLEEDVKRILQIQGWRVTSELLVEYKKVDCLIEKKVHFGRMERIAVECKDYSGALTQSEAAEIYANYLPLVQNGMIDYLMLVTRNEIAPSAKTFCSAARGMMHTSYFMLLNSLIDFSGYVHGLISQYRYDDLDRYYVPQSCREVLLTEEDSSSPVSTAIASVEEEIFTWIESDSADPVAVLAGYGMGKTTLAKRIAYLLARSFTTDSQSRIPILIRLEDIGSEQSLEGLLGTQFTSRSVVDSYNFNIFMELNSRGRFVIILDGFDEMKQAMSWETMRYNFSQLNRLVVPGAKVMLGGRPSAFLSEEEYLEVLHGRRRILGRLRSIPDWPDYQEFHLESFSDEQIKSFVESYALILAERRAVTEIAPNAHKLIDTISHEENKELLALARRPVQLKMILELFPYWEDSLDKLTLTALYSEFIDLIIRRETEKRARKHFSIQQRRRFVASLAWWMWEESKGTAVKLSDIPDSVFSSFVDDTDIPLSDLKRDLLGACFLEVKQPEGYYFPHRSFQEFLIAERLVDLLKSGKFRLEKKVPINAEIQEFVVGLMGGHDWEVWRGKILKYRGVMDDWVIDLFLRFIQRPDDCLDSLSSPWEVVAAARGILTNRWKLSGDESADFLRRLLLSLNLGEIGYERRMWAKMFMMQAILLRQRLIDAGISFKDVMARYMSVGGVAEEFQKSKRIHASEAFDVLLTPGFCQLDSWKNESSNVVFGIGRQGVRLRIGQSPATKKQGGSPHKRAGVTPKKRF
jgi:hypothetical protein